MYGAFYKLGNAQRTVRSRLVLYFPATSCNSFESQPHRPYLSDSLPFARMCVTWAEYTAYISATMISAHIESAEVCTVPKRSFLSGSTSLRCHRGTLHGGHRRTPLSVNSACATAGCRGIAAYTFVRTDCQLRDLPL